MDQWKLPCFAIDVISVTSQEALKYYLSVSVFKTLLMPSLKCKHKKTTRYESE